MSDKDAGVVMETKKTTYWHFSYYLRGSDTADGMGHTVFSTNNDVFPIVDAMKFVKATHTADSCVILAWRELRKEQFDAFMEYDEDDNEPFESDLKA